MLQGKVKVSVLLSEQTHRRLKLASIERHTSIQKAMEDLAQKWITNEEAGNAAKAPVSMSNNEMRAWQARLRQILESGDPLAILNCTASIRAMEALLQQREAASHP